jgi:hypothetical protein
MMLEQRVAKLESDIFALQLKSSATLPYYEPIKKTSHGFDFWFEFWFEHWFEFWCALIFGGICFGMGMDVGTTRTLRSHRITECQTPQQENPDGVRGPVDPPGHETR